MFASLLPRYPFQSQPFMMVVIEFLDGELCLDVRHVYLPFGWLLDWFSGLRPGCTRDARRRVAIGDKGMVQIAS